MGGELDAQIWRSARRPGAPAGGPRTNVHWRPGSPGRDPVGVDPHADSLQPIRLLVVDDAPAVRAGLCAFFETVRGIDVVGCARDGGEGIELCLERGPDVVLMDLRMP